MKKKDFFLKHYTIFYGFICIFANLLAVASTNITSFPLPDNVSINEWTSFLDSKHILVDSLSIFCYLIPVVLCVLYVIRARKFNSGDKEFIKFQVHIPAAFSLLGITGKKRYKAYFCERK